MKTTIVLIALLATAAIAAIVPAADASPPTCGPSPYPDHALISYAYCGVQCYETDLETQSMECQVGA
ncbi:MAG: hypothetical protein QOE90_275 [Thermoplasmata archaeon]|jgi:hypothetical protein|nr:hypothetical protein [Thermoplasmata archaeon]